MTTQQWFLIENIRCQSICLYGKYQCVESKKKYANMNLCTSAAYDVQRAYFYSTRICEHFVRRSEVSRKDQTTFVPLRCSTYVAFSFWMNVYLLRFAASDKSRNVTQWVTLPRRLTTPALQTHPFLPFSLYRFIDSSKNIWRPKSTIEITFVIPFLHKLFLDAWTIFDRSHLKKPMLLLFAMYWLHWKRNLRQRVKAFLIVRIRCCVI